MQEVHRPGGGAARGEAEAPGVPGIEAVLGEAADGTPVDPTWPQRFLDTLAQLRAHILKEQDDVFPAALARLSAAEWEAVEAVRARVGTALPGAVG